MNLLFLNETANSSTTRRDTRYSNNNIINPNISIKIMQRALIFISKNCETISELDQKIKILSSYNTEEKKDQLTDIRIELLEVVQKIKKVLHEFKVAFSVPDDNKDSKSMKNFLDRFLFLEERIDLYYVTLKIEYIGQAEKQLQILMNSFKMAESYIQKEDVHKAQMLKDIQIKDLVLGEEAAMLLSQVSENLI